MERRDYQPLEPYRLVGEIFAHDGPVRSLTIGPLGEIVSGCQSGSPNVRRFAIHYKPSTQATADTDSDLMAVENDSLQNSQEMAYDEVGSPLFHDHWVTSVTSLPSGLSEHYPEGCLITGCMDGVIRIFDTVGNPLQELRGHGKGVISLSWTADHRHLLSGSWDCTARAWDMTQNPPVLAYTLQPHENGVHVLGLRNGSVATTSTGEAVNDKPANFRLRCWDVPSGNTASPIETVNDHEGPIRSIFSLHHRDLDLFATTSNDGSVKVRAGTGKDVVSTLYHPSQDDGSPPLLLDGTGLHTASGLGVVSCGEDGSVMVWDKMEVVQSIPHAGCVWCVLGLPGTEGDFVTGSNDGILRIFSRDPTKVNSLQSRQLHSAFTEAVQQAQRQARRGPSAEEIAKAVKWENRFSHPGKSAGMVQVFNKNGTLIAAQWDAPSGSWVEIGEVTGKGGDGGTVHGVSYDHVMPVEVEDQMSQSGTRNLKLGYNDGEHPYDAAQRFIEENGLPVTYLRQIADWIMSNKGNKTPTFDMASNASSVASSTTNPMSPPQPSFTYVHLPLRAITVYDDLPSGFRSKLLPKVTEFNSTTPPPLTLTEQDLANLSTLLSILEDTSHYHSNALPVSLLQSIYKMCQWDAAKSFPAFDLARLVAVHLSGSSSLSSHIPSFHTLFDSIVSLLPSDPASPSTSFSSSSSTSSAASALTATRFLCNCMKHPTLRAHFFSYPKFTELVSGVLRQADSPNKTLRAATSVFCMNLCLSVYQQPSTLQTSERSSNSALSAYEKSALRASLLVTLHTLMLQETEAWDIVQKALLGLGTLGMLAGDAEGVGVGVGGGVAAIKSFVKTSAGHKTFASLINEVLVQRWDNKMGEVGKAVLEEVRRLIIS